MLRQSLLIGWFVLAPMAFAQNVFLTAEAGQAEIVKQVQGQDLLVERQGKLVVAKGTKHGFARATVYNPGLVTFDPNFAIIVWHQEVLHEGGLGWELRVEGRATSDTTFRHCFIVMEEVAPTEKGFAFAGIPDLVAGEAVQVRLTFPLRAQPEMSNYRLHLFSNGVELLHSKMKPPYLALQQQKTADLLSRKVKDFPAIFAHGPDPAYPEALKETGGTGSARVRCHVTKNGDVASTELVRASAPAFGEAALAAAPKWKFDPAIKNLQFVESDVEVPIDFKPPKKT